MKIESIIETESTYTEVLYKKKRPPDKFVCCREGSFLCILEHIGPGLDYWVEAVGPLSDHYLGMPPTDGFYFWVGGLRSFTMETDYGTDYDCELDGEYIKVTAEDFEDYSTNESWWDSSLWLEEDPTL